MTTFKTFAIYAGAVICFGGLIFAGIRMMSGRFQFTKGDREGHVRTGDFGTVERVGDLSALFVRVDNGKIMELRIDQTLHVEYGYAVETAQRSAVDRVLITGEASQLAQEEAVLINLSPHIRDLTLHTSDKRDLIIGKDILGVQVTQPTNRSLSDVGSISTPEIDRHGFGITR
jgi:hypothetical protein